MLKQLVLFFAIVAATQAAELKIAKYTIHQRGQLNTLDYRCYIKDSETNQFVSPFHDIPLFSDKRNNTINVVIEIPRWTNAKMEISKSLKLNPIMQDVKNGKLRFVNNVFPHHGYIWNYGGIPQTWEDPNMIDKETGCIGDNDPLDVLEIGSAVLERGTVAQVKVLGALGLIDEGEADWKIVSINVNDPLAEKLNDINDVEAEMPGFLNATRDWFKVYKMPAGRPANNFAADGKFYDRKFALEIVNHDYACWLNLIKGGYDAEPEKKMGIQLNNTCLEYSDLKLTNEAAEQLVNDDSKEFVAEPAEIDLLPIQTVYYVNRSNLKKNKVLRDSGDF